MAEAAALLVDEVFPEQPIRQWVLSFPYPLRFLFANKPEVMTHVLAIVYRVIATHLIKKAGFTRKSAHTGAVTLIQRFGSALNLNLHFHMLFLGYSVYLVGMRERKVADKLNPQRISWLMARSVRSLAREQILHQTGDAQDQQQ